MWLPYRADSAGRYRAHFPVRNRMETDPIAIRTSNIVRQRRLLYLIGNSTATTERRWLFTFFLYLNYLKCRKIRAAGRCLMHRLTMFHCKGLDGNFWIKLHHGAMFPRKRLKFWGYSTLLFFSTAVSIRFVYFRVNGLGLLFIPDFPF